MSVSGSFRRFTCCCFSHPLLRDHILEQHCARQSVGSHFFCFEGLSETRFGRIMQIEGEGQSGSPASTLAARHTQQGYACRL